MNRISRLITVIGIVSILFGLSCAPEQKKEQEEKELMDIESVDQPQTFGETYYQIPSPEELFAFVKGGQLSYKSTLLNPIENAEKYVDVKSKELNFGIYTADLAYAAAFGRYQESLDNIETVRELSDEIGISSVFDESLNSRIRNIFENPDSLLDITNSSYYKIVNYLEANEREKTLALIAAGGWIESLYIFSHLVELYDENDPTIQRIADQKLTYENLVNYLEKYKDDPAVLSTLETIKPITIAFSKLEMVEVEQRAPKPENENVIVVGGSKKIKMTQSQFENLKTALAKVRNTITMNS